MGVKIERGSEPGPALDIKSLRQFLENNRGWERFLFIDSNGNYFLPQNITADEAVEGIIISPTADMAFTYAYGRDNTQRFRLVIEPIKFTLTFNQ